jgi:peptidoglycan/LPS O-acetylase OafA/YrhL
VEEQFYILWPAIFILFCKDLQRLSKLVGALILSVWFYRLVLIWVLSADQAYIYRAFETRFDHLLAGCFLAILLKRRALDKWIARICAARWMPLIPLALLCCSGYLEGFNQYRDSIGFIVDPLLIAALLVQCVYFSGAWPWGWLNWQPIRWLGKISYSLYLYQQVAIHPVKHILEHHSVVIQLGGAIIVTILLAAISYYAIELPFLALRKSLFRQTPREKSEMPRPELISKILEIKG